jgi:aminoglycoside 6-adenylyltransferase
MMNGSRANPMAPHDLFQDFDIVYFVTDDIPYTRNLEWIKRFGELMILQLPDDMADPPPVGADGYCYLMQFMDGNRIDLSIYPIASLAKWEKDSQTIILLDKDGLFPDVPPASNKDYLPKPPTARQFFDCTNEFWWVSPYAAKGLWRREFPYARTFVDEYIREQLNKMLTWYIGIKTGFQVDAGKLGKYFERSLEPELWQMLLETFADGTYEQTWRALFKMAELFRITAIQVAEYYGYEYPYGDDERVSAHIRHVKDLPRDATTIYSDAAAVGEL